MSQKFISTQHQLLDLVAESTNTGDFPRARQYFYKLAVNCNTRKLKFDPSTGYTSILFADWMHSLNTELLQQNATLVLEAQSAVYEMLDALV